LYAAATDEAKDLISITFSNGVVNSDKTNGTVTVGVLTPLSGSLYSGKHAVHGHGD